MFKKGKYKNLIKTVSAAILGTMAKNNVTDVGEPSYTSGAHIWKGTTGILNAKPTRININPKVKPYWLEFMVSEIIIKFVEPEKPYIREQPYSNKPDDKALNIKYFNPASDDFIWSLLKEAKTYKASDCNSRAIKIQLNQFNKFIFLVEIQLF